ncbi:MAG: T9SS type A sorting domain-containing protein, partial [Ignavibacteriaceae bacterium]|nr:T9SS type A sorting domain-containing protein [Ignavibacteriaceae bacterium]
DNNIKGVIIHPDGLLLCGTENGGIFIADLIPTNVDNINNSLVNFSLQQNYPNPFNPGTIITWQLAVSSDVTIKVYDVLGNEVATLVNEEKPAGKYEVKFNGSGLSSGLYFYQLKAGSFIQTKKMLLLK